MNKKVVIIGPAYPLRGGLASFNMRLCRQFLAEGDSCSIYSFSLQYPGFLFPGKSQYSTDPPPADLSIFTVINSINPLNWLAVGSRLKKIKPDIILVRFWLPFMGPALGTLLRRVKKNNHTRIVALVDNAIPHEKRPGDQAFTQYFLNSCHAFITMSEKVAIDLTRFKVPGTVITTNHPLYDNFGEGLPQQEARQKLGLPEQKKILLFFGFIRKYKGLDLLLEALKILKDERGHHFPYHLVIAGEFYEDEKPFRDLALQYHLNDVISWHANFIADEAVKLYFSAANVVIQPYRQATQSGVTPLSYHFNVPMIVTRTGSLPDKVPHEKAGLHCDPTAPSVAAAIKRFFELGEAHFIPHLRKEKEKYSWSVLTGVIRQLSFTTENQEKS